MRKECVAVRCIAPLAVAAATAAGATLAPVARAEAAGDVSVTVGLRAADHGAIARLAREVRLPHGQRMRELLRAAPAAAARGSVTQAAEDSGLVVTGSNRFSVTLKGSAASVASFAAAERKDATASYVVVNDQPGFFQPETELTGPVARSAYHSPSGVAPSGVQPTVATIQFSGWNAADLTGYATSNGLSDPVAAGQYSAVSVDGANPAVPDGRGGDGEVALDQESLLASAPYLNQRAYFAPNNGAGGLLDALNRVATDALDVAHDGYHLSAVSISYGSCELDWTNAELDALDQALSNVLAAGVTVFAASGDGAGYDCLDRNYPAVVLPAAHPLVVGVGGTSLETSAGVVDERVWSDPATASGSGGGISQVYAEPAYQKSVMSADGRVVPDIALDGDPQTGFSALLNGEWMIVGGTSLAAPLAAATFSNMLATSDMPYGIGDILPNLYAAPSAAFRDITSGENAVYSARRGYDAVTGLGAPLWHQLAGSLIGSPTLQLPRYSATRSVALEVSTPPGMRYSRWTAGVGAEPTSCSTGVTTLHAPSAVTVAQDGPVQVWVEGQTAFYCYTDSAITFVDTHAPVSRAVARRAGARGASFTWSASDASPSSGLSRYDVKVFRSGTTSPVHARSYAARGGVTLQHLVRGRTYTLRVTTRDHANNTSAVATARVVLPR